MVRRINLHARVRRAINRVYPDETVQLYRSNGNSTDERGFSKPTFQPPISVKANVQSVDKTGFNDVIGSIKNKYEAVNTQISYNFYIYSDDSLANKVEGINRAIARGGDMIQREDGTWFLVTSVKEDFSRVGWQKVIGTQQIKGVTEEQIEV